MSTNVVLVGLRKPVSLCLVKTSTVKQLKERVSPGHCADYYLCCGGSPLDDDDVITPSSQLCVLTAHYRLCGGKGGFGSLIRATGSHRNRNADKSACRDISGRRMRDIKNEKKVAEWVAGESDRNRQRTERKKRRQQKLLEEPRHTFDDSSYMDAIRSTEEGMAESLKRGLQQDNDPSSSSSLPPAKKAKLWMHSEDLSSSSDDDDSSPSPSASHSGSCEEVVISQVMRPSNKEGSPSPKEGTSPDSPPLGVSAAPPTPPGVSAAPPTPPGVSAVPPTPPGVSAAPSTPPGVSAVPPTPPGVSAVVSLEEVVDPGQYSSVEDLLAVGGELLKRSLSSRGLKCGGTPLERARRLFSIKGLCKEQIPAKLLAKTKKK